MSENNDLISKPTPDLLWHYTGSAGLRGILRSGCIWASDINLLNDATENIRAKQLLREAVALRASYDGEQARADYKEIVDCLGLEGVVAADLKLTPKTYKNSVQALLQHAVWSGSGNDIFIACFSARADSLSQWRAYSGVGGSYSIGFSRESLLKYRFGNPQEKQSKDFVRKWFKPVEYYSPLKHDERFNDYATLLIAEWLQAPQGVTWVEGLIGDESSFFKDEAFFEEQEWRLKCAVNLDGSRLDLRAGRSHLIPYIEVPLPDDVASIREIMIGPGPSIELDKRALESYRDSRHHSFEVTKSAIPFRNW